MLLLSLVFVKIKRSYFKIIFNMLDLYEKIGYCGFLIILLMFIAVFAAIRGIVLSIILKKNALNKNGIIKAIADNIKKQSLTTDTAYINSLMQIELKGMFSSLYFLKLCAAVGPLLGLLGTVLGMVEVFSVIAQKTTPEPTVLASGIWQALITTVMGLSLAIPSLIIHYYLLSNLRFLKTTITLLSRQ